MERRWSRTVSLSFALTLAIPLCGATLGGDRLARAADEASIRGVVTDQTTGEPIEGAVVVLSCSCLVDEREVETNARGIYRFDDLLPGNYTVQVLTGKANVSKVVALPRGAQFRTNFRVDPANAFVKKIVVESHGVYEDTSAAAIDMEQAKQLPVGGSRSRSFTSVVGVAPSASRDSVGRRPRGRDAYRHGRERERTRTAIENTTTFSIDVDTAAYANVRRFIREGGYVPPEAVRIEEMINYFDYGDRAPGGRDPIAVHAELAESPFSDHHALLRIAVKAEELPRGPTPARNLVFLLDVSGSMHASDKLALLKSAMHRLTDTLRPIDRVAVVTYAGAAEVVLAPTSGRDKERIHAAIDRLEAGGGTNGSGGIELAYELAARHFDRAKINRVILGTDGDFNIGPASDAEMERIIERKRETGVYLSVLGVGTGNLMDSKMERMADHGNGNYSYLDSVEEAEKVLVTEAGQTTITVAEDVKVQVAFDPRTVRSFRQIGYENRQLSNRDFADDSKDAGEIGAGDVAVAYYDLALNGRSTRSIGEVRVRYKAPQAKRSQQFDVDLPKRSKDLRSTSSDYRFGVAVAAFGLWLRHSKHLGDMAPDEIIALAEQSSGPDPHGRRGEFVDLVRSMVERGE